MPFEFRGGIIAARELTIEDDDQIARLIGKLPPGAIVNSGTPFMEFMIGADVKGEPPVPMITPESDPSEIAESYAVWKKLPRRFLTLWRQELTNADSPDPKA